jgi:hypothetical protein
VAPSSGDVFSGLRKLTVARTRVRANLNFNDGRHRQGDGMVEIKGKFTNDGNPAAGACLSLTLEHDDPNAEFIVIEEGEEVEYSGYRFMLGSSGELPSGACVRGTDEIQPAGSRYSLEVSQMRGTHFRHYYSRGQVEITGDGPVDLTPPPEPEPEVIDPFAGWSPRARELWAADAAIVRDGTMKFGKKNRIGFFAGVQCPTSSAGSVSLPSGENGIFGVFPFSLPFAAVVNRVSILVDTADKGAVAIGIYDASGSKRSDVSIDVSRPGIAAGMFPNEVNLSEGDYFLAWRTDRVCSAQLRGISVLDQLNLLNASGVTLMGVGRSQPGGALPEMLGVIVSNATSRGWYGTTYAPIYAPILVYFKS